MLKSLLASTLFALALSGCASAPKAPQNAQGGKIPVQVMIDGGWEQVDTTNAGAVGQRTQLLNYMKVTTVDQLNASGYQAKSIASKADYDAQDGARFLKISVTHYNPGSAAARMLVGLGAGAAVLDTHAEYLDKGRKLCDVSNSIASSRDWRKIVKKTNILIMQEMGKYGAN